MADQIVPTIGAQGEWQFKAPFDQLAETGAVYTCQGIRTISDLIAQGEDPLVTIYVNQGLADADFTRDKVANIYIISLQSSSGGFLIVPASYILGYPITNGVPYHNVMLGVLLGAVPTEMDLSTLNTAISNLVYDYLGIRPQINPVQVSKVALFAREDHKMLEVARQQRVSQTMSDSGRAKALENQFNSLLQKHGELEQYIINNML